MSAEQMIDEASALMANSFHNTASFLEIFREENPIECARKMKYFFSCFLTAVYLDSSTKYMYPFYDNDGKMEVFFMLIPSSFQLTLWSKIRAGILSFPFVFGWSGFSRMLTAGDYHDAHHLKVMTANGVVRNHMLVQRMVVRIDKQGRGLGSLRLGQKLRDIADAQQLPVVLDTQDSRNVPFYTRL